MNWYLKALKNYVGFTGRARRTEFWMYTLFYFIIIVAAALIDGLLGTSFGYGYGGFIYLIAVLFHFLPSLGVAVRRLHDTGKSGWMILVSLIPLIGFIWLIILYVTEGDHGDNAYGPDPKNESVDTGALDSM